LKRKKKKQQKQDKFDLLQYKLNNKNSVDQIIYTDDSEFDKNSFNGLKNTTQSSEPKSVLKPSGFDKSAWNAKVK